MNWFENQKNEWREIIDTVANETGKSRLLIEKDTIQTMLLKKLASIGVPIVFKGGTSLSKIYRIIDRFSEDIDLSASRKLSEKEKKTVKLKIIEFSASLGLQLVNPESIKSRGNYNKYIFEYDSLFEEKARIIVETSFYQIAYPIEECKINSYVYEFIPARKIIDSISKDFSDGKIVTQSYKRTFADKLFAVCDYYIANKPERESRHLYDIYKLIEFVELDDEFAEIFSSVKKDRSDLGRSPSADSKYNINQILKKIISEEFYKGDYNQLTKNLLFEKADYRSVVEKGLRVVVDSSVLISKTDNDEL